MNAIKRLFLLFSLFVVIMPIGAMEQGDKAKEGFFAQLWNFGKENPIVASLGVAASLVGVYAGKHYLQSKRNQALFDAAREGSAVGVQAALARGADISSQDDYYGTALHIASLFGRLEVVKYLISCGADIEAKNSCGETPLHIGSREGRLEVVKHLISYGADIDAKNRYGETPLHIASDYGQIEIVKYLISVGADIEAKNVCDNTALHRASLFGRLEVVKYLAAMGANIEAKSEYGQTAFGIAMKNARHLVHGDEIILALIQRSHFITPNMHTEESQKRLQATMHIAKTCGLPKDLGKKILSFVPEDLVSADHAKVVFNYGSELRELVPHCPLRWFNKIYQDTYDSEKPAFLEKVVPIIVEYRLGKVKELLAGKISQDPVIASIIDSDSVEQHRAAITMHVTNGILGIEEEPEHREE